MLIFNVKIDRKKFQAWDVSMIFVQLQYENVSQETKFHYLVVCVLAILNYTP